GPGALNLVTGLATAFMDSVPMVAITGQVASPMVGRDAFQESDVVGCTQPVTKHNYLVRDVRDIPRAIKEAFHIATTGRPGPVLLDICKDAQQASWDDPVWPETVDLPGYRPDQRSDIEAALDAAAEALAKAERPVILAGHGVLLSGATEELQALAEKAAVPTGTTLLGIGAFPVQHPLALHMTGFMGTGWNNLAVQNADVLLCVGMRVDDRVTADLAKWAPRVETFVHIDIDRSEMGKNVRPHLEIVADAKEALAALTTRVQSPPTGRSTWLTQIERWREEHPLKYIRSNGHLQPQDVMLEMYRRCDSRSIVVADVGQNQIWAALWWNYASPGLFLNSGGAGTMGFALPAAIGAQVGRPDRTVWAVAGEGGFVMTSQELSVAVEQNLPVKIVILDNRSLGMVRQFQDDYYGGVRSESAMEHMPDFAKLAGAYGLPGYHVRSLEDVPMAFDAAQRWDGPFLLHFSIDPDANVYPIVPLGGGLTEFQELPDVYA
ncbi:MAG: biosynthetic-type acetolactate synthase large subunit, partial [Candidatus Dormibacteraceae bacterium]